MRKAAGVVMTIVFLLALGKVTYFGVWVGKALHVSPAFGEALNCLAVLFVLLGAGWSFKVLTGFKGSGNYDD